MDKWVTPSKSIMHLAGLVIFAQVRDPEPKSIMQEPERNRSGPLTASKGFAAAAAMDARRLRWVMRVGR